MKVFQHEIIDGLEAKINSSASISYATIVEPSANINKHNVKHIKSLASVNDGDLYYVQSILVSSDWNKNDDIFDKAEVWAAKNTPEDKPTNLEHNENDIVGHITSNWPITDDGILIDENTPVDNLPEKFHILTGSVIYKAFSATELQQRAQKLISEIETGKKYVSMECLFNNFDYGLINKSTGEYKILPRNEDTAYLTKYLRAYGGVGEHENYKIGRVLRNITFSGKGFVDKPANPDSVIFTKNMFTQASEKNLAEKIEDFSEPGVSNNQLNLNVETITMNLEQEITELKATIASLEQDNAAKADLINNYVSELEAMKQTKEETTKAYDETMKTHQEALLENEQLKKDLEDTKKTIEAYQAKEAERAKQEMMAKRMASLTDLGVDAESAEATVNKFESLDDEAFAAITQLLASSVQSLAKKTEKKEDEEKEEAKNDVAGKEEEKEEEKDSPKQAELGKKTKSSVDAEILETAELEDSVNLSVGGQVESVVESTRAALVEFISNRLGKKL